MDFLKAQYDRILLAVGGVILIASAALIFLKSQSFVAAFSERNSAAPRDNTLPQLPLDAIQASVNTVRKPRVWGIYDGSLFVSRPYVLADGKLVDPLEDSEMIHPPVENAWIAKYNLDFSDPHLLDADPDSDGFSVLEEWMAKTDPTDPTAKPPYYTKLRLRQFIQIPFRLKFQGSPDGGESFAINTIDLRQPTQFVKIGDMIEGTPFKVISYEYKTKVENEIEKDVSELIIENTETKERIVLVNDQVHNSPSSRALFEYLLDGSSFEVKLDDQFSLNDDPETKYKLIDITEQQAVIQNVSTGEKIDIPALTP